MEQFDGSKSNGVGLSINPGYTPRGASPLKFVTCGSKIYPQYINMIQQELVNAIEGAGLTLDAEDDTQLSQAIKSARSAYIINQGSTNGPGGTASITLTKTATQEWDIVTCYVMWQVQAQGSVRYDSVSITGGVDSSVTNLIAGTTYAMQSVDDPVGEALELPIHIFKFVPTNKTQNTLSITLNYTLSGEHVNHSAFGEGIARGF